MSRNLLRSVAAAVAALAVGAALAGAREDLRIDRKSDEKRNTLFVLVNKGNRLIEAKVSMFKNCTGNRKQPRTRTFWVSPHDEVRLAKAWAETSCRHEYKILEATYR